MNIMQEHNDHPNDKWLDELLTQPPKIADEDFTAGITKLIEQQKKQRRLILGITYFLGLILIGVLTPWSDALPWLSAVSETVNAVGIKDGSLIGWQPIALVLMPFAFFWAFLQREFN